MSEKRPKDENHHLAKMIVMMLILSLVPLGAVGYLSLQDEKTIGLGAANDAQVMGEQIIDDSTLALNTLGAQVIQQKAQDVARQIEIYLADHPEATVTDLQNDTFFSTIAVQPVGQTGYTALTDVDTLICRFHKNPKLVNSDLHNLNASLPGSGALCHRAKAESPLMATMTGKNQMGPCGKVHVHRNCKCHNRR